MKSNFPLNLIAALLVMSCSGIAADQTKKKTASAETAKSDAEKWLTSLGKKGLVVKETAKTTPFSGKYFTGPNSTSFQFAQEGWWITVGFSGKITSDPNLKDLQKRLTFVAIDKLPTPGLEVPGWEIKPQTPTSRIERGIEVVALKDGALTLRVKTRCFALYGTDPKAMRLVPADAGAPKSAYFQIRRPFPLDLTLTAPLRLESTKKK